MNSFQQFFTMPYFDDDVERTQRARLLYVTSMVLFLLPLGLMVLNLVIGNAAERSANTALFFLTLFQIPVLWLVRQGRIWGASVILIVVCWSAMTWIATRVEGVRDVAVVTYFLIILGAGYLLGWRAVTLLTTWTILAIWFLALYEKAGYIHPAVGDPIRIAVDLTVILVIASLEIYFILHTLTRSLEHARRELMERQRIEHMLRDEREKLALALDASKMETWNWNVTTGAVSWSDGIEAMFGIDAGQFDGKYETYLGLIHPEDISRLQGSINQALNDENYNYVVEHRIVQPGGNIRWLEGRGRVYRDELGRPVRMAGTVVDISDRKQSEAEREQLIQELAGKNNELEQFTYTVSHDLKAPIITIKGFLGFLLDDIKAERVERVDKDILRITDAVDKMHRLLAELLELSRIGRMMNPPKEIPFADLVGEAADVLQGRLQSSGVKIEYEKDLPTVYGDRHRLLEVVQNLIDNAAKFSAGREAPLIQIGLTSEDKSAAVFFIRDNGIGIPPEHHERIFGLFHKLDPTAEGTGVGLALVKRIVEFHGGKIWVESTVGSGTTFYFTLPLAGLKDHA